MTKSRIIYLAGPMRGYADYNFPEFHRVAKLLRDLGHKVFNPAENDELREKHGLPTTVRHVLRDDLVFICEHAEFVALLNGWEKSKGANAELATAVAIGVPALPFAEFL